MSVISANSSEISSLKNESELLKKQLSKGQQHLNAIAEERIDLKRGIPEKDSLLQADSEKISKLEKRETKLKEVHSSLNESLTESKNLTEENTSQRNSLVEKDRQLEESSNKINGHQREKLWTLENIINTIKKLIESNYTPNTNDPTESMNLIIVA